MACFAAPVAEAVIVTAATKIMKKKEAASASESKNEIKLPFSEKLTWLKRMLWGGSALLCNEHIWPGEIVPFFPFLTAASSAESFSKMLREVSTVGVAMSAAVTLVWVGMVVVSSVMEKRSQHLTQPSVSE